MSNLARVWTACGVHVTMLRFCSKTVPVDELGQMSGVRLEFCYISSWMWKLVMMLERFFTRLCPYNVQHTIRNLLLWETVKRRFVNGDFDCVVTSLPGHGSLFLARKISKWMRIPLVVDFRDLPDEFDPARKKLRMKIECWAVRRALHDAALVTVVSPLWPKIMKKRFAVEDAKVVMNGYEGVLPKSSTGALDMTGKLTVFYAGSMAYGRDRNLKMLFEALDQLANGGIDISMVEVTIAGVYRKDWYDSLKQFRSFTVFNHIGRIPRAEALARQQNASVLLNIASPEAPGVMPSKIFEYAKARRPVLNIPSKTDVLAHFVLKSRIGECCERVDEIADYFRRKIIEWREKGRLPDPEADMEYLKQFSRTVQSKVFLEYIKGVV